MFIVISMQGCLPYLEIEKEKETYEAKLFDTYEKAEKYAKKNCAWSYYLVDLEHPNNR